MGGWNTDFADYTDSFLYELKEMKRRNDFLQNRSFYRVLPQEQPKVSKKVC